MTYPEKVNRYNIDRLRKAVVNGPEVHPGANTVRSVALGTTTTLSFGGITERQRRADTLKIGDTVDRHMHDDDVVLFNRQPSLHKMSIMSHRVKVQVSAHPPSLSLSSLLGASIRCCLCFLCCFYTSLIDEHYLTSLPPPSLSPFSGLI